MIEIAQGDQYALEITLKDQNGEPITPDVADVVEISIAKYTKSTIYGGVEYSDFVGAWLFPVSQRETFALPVGEYIAQARVKFRNSDDVYLIELGGVKVKKSKSSEVL